MLAAARWRSAWVTVPLGLVALAAYSLAIEPVQLELARIDRACDVTDVIDNVTGRGGRGRDRAAAGAGPAALAAATSAATG